MERRRLDPRGNRTVIRGSRPGAYLGDNPDNEVMSKQNTRAGVSVSIRTRIIAAVILVAGAALTVSGVLVFILQQRALDARAVDRLHQSKIALQDLVEGGTNPETGVALTDPSEIVRLHLARTYAGTYTGEVGFVDGTLYWLPSQEPRLHIEDDAELVAYVAPLTTGTDTIITTHTTTTTTYRLIVVPIAGPSSNAALVHTIDMHGYGESTHSAMVLYVVAALGTLVLVVPFAWFSVTRLLRPIGELRRATDSIGESDLTTRVPVRGNDDLSGLAGAVNRMLDRVETAVVARRELLDDVSHELRTPITVVRGHMELLDPDDHDDVVETRALVIDEIDRMGTLVGDLLELARASDTVNPASTDLAALTEAVLDKARALGDRQWTLDEAAQVTCCLDPTRITQAWLQLAQNAVQYSADGTLIAIGSGADSQWARLWVRDRGIGIAPDDIECVRQRFVRGTAGTESVAGSGLGLNIVESIARAHGGHLDIESTPGVGSTFTLVIPQRPCGASGETS